MLRKLCGCRFEILFVTAANDDLRAAIDKACCDTLADSAATASDKCDLVFDAEEIVAHGVGPQSLFHTEGES